MLVIAAVMANVHPTGTDSAELSIGTTYPAMMSSLAFATVHVTEAGDGSATPDCAALTAKVCSPSVSPS